jgi:hypothetical protein
MENKFTINNIRILSSWNYNLSTNVDCTICRCNLNVNSLYNQEKGLDSEVIQGTCGHAFHSECIIPWIVKNKHCPICSSIWSKAHVYK